MSKEKQIEDMAGIIFESNTIPLVWHSDAVRFAETLYNAGYRKRSEGEWIIKGDYLKIMECSACGMMSASIHEKTRFCPNCGAKIKGGEE